jgi:predicted ester cyclase
MREWYADYLDACNRHDLAAIGEFIAPDVRRAHLPGGVDAWLDDLAELFAGFPDWRWRRIQLLVEDDRIAVHLRGSGTHTGAFRGIAPTRRRVNVAEFAFLHVTGGRIVEHTGTTDYAELLAQLRS